MAEVFLCQTGQLTPASRRELKRAGIVVVEVEDPTRCQFIRSSEKVSADDMLYAALDALRSNKGDRTASADGQREQFTLNMFELLDAARSAEGRPPLGVRSA